MRDVFVDFLVNQCSVPAGACEQLRKLLRGAPEPVGAIAFKFGLVTTDDIDTILDEQRSEHRPFGEIAIELKILTRPQVDALLRVQQVRAATEIAEALSLSGALPTDIVMLHLGDFLRQGSTTESKCTSRPGRREAQTA